MLKPEYKNIVLWACLLHDLRKLSTPIIDTKDHIHPFKSAIAVLEVFKQMRILEVESEERLNAF